VTRVSYVDKEELPDEYQHLPFHKPEDPTELPEEYRHLLGQDERNVHRVLSHSPPVFEAFKNFNSVLWNQVSFNPKTIERCILSIARHLDSAYEWHAHVRIGLYEGLEPKEILAISNGNHDIFPEEEQVLFSFIAKVADDTITADDVRNMKSHYNERQIVEAAMLTGCYLVMQRLLSTFAVDVEEEFVGWNLENL
jgi:alkylhydroperoxidase family enzyme